MNIVHIPNGDMCIGCTHALRKCNHLDFPSMQVMDKKDKQYPIVKCTDYKRPSVSSPVDAGTNQ
jgi:hypothetical protein